jgi:hypothetical protein
MRHFSFNLIKYLPYLLKVWTHKFGNDFNWIFNLSSIVNIPYALCLIKPEWKIIFVWIILKLILSEHIKTFYMQYELMSTLKL